MQPAAHPKVNLREAQKARTRQRILDAAREVFAHDGYFGATIEQIASAAGASRPTFYLHFSGKEQILADLIESYRTRTLLVMERFPAPDPTLEQVRGWLLAFAAVLKGERTAFFLISEVSAHSTDDLSNHGRMAVASWLGALGRRAPAFAAGPGDPRAEVRAQLLILEILWAASAQNWGKKGSPATDCAIDIVAEALCDFVHARKAG